VIVVSFSSVLRIDILTRVRPAFHLSRCLTIRDHFCFVCLPARGPVGLLPGPSTINMHGLPCQITRFV